mgnify:CR=1 FL=1
MKKKSNLNSTKDDLIKNFNQQQLEIYNYYKSKFSYTGTELITIDKDDKEITFLENGYSALKSIFKVELVFALIIFTFAIIFDIFPENSSNNKGQEYVASSSIEDLDYSYRK